jgi:hypothetical protein
MLEELSDGVDWPPTYIDPHTGIEHGWDDPVPTDTSGPDYAGYGPDRPYTYRELAYDQAAGQGRDIDEYLEHLAFRRGEGLDEKMSPDFIDDGDGYGA